MPSVVNVGGIRMSVSTASGRCSADGAVQRVGVGDRLDEVDLGGLGEQPRHALAHEVVVVGEDDPHGHGLTVGPVMAPPGPPKHAMMPPR